MGFHRAIAPAAVVALTDWLAATTVEVVPAEAAPAVFAIPNHCVQMPTIITTAITMTMIAMEMTTLAAPM